MGWQWYPFSQTMLLCFWLYDMEPILLKDEIWGTKFFPIILEGVADEPDVSSCIQPTIHNLQTPLAAMHPHTWTLQPPCLTVGTKQSCLNLSPFLLLTKALLLGISSKIDSAEKSIFLHCWGVQFFLSRHHSSLFYLWVSVRRGFLAATHPLKPDFRSFLLTVLHDISLPVASSKALFMFFDMVHLSERARWERRRFCRGVVELGQPERGLSFTIPVSAAFFRIFWTAQLLILSFCNCTPTVVLFIQSYHCCSLFHGKISSFGHRFW